MPHFKEIEIRNEMSDNGNFILYIEDGIQAYLAEQFNEALRYIKNRSDVKSLKVIINCRGGSVIPAMSMFYNVLSFGKPTLACITGLSGSAASWLMLAFNKVQIVDYGLVYTHPPYATDQDGNRVSSGDSSVDDMINAFAGSITKIYARRLGKTDQEAENFISKDNWMNATEAKEAGLVDEVIETSVKNEILEQVEEALNKYKSKEVASNELSDTVIEIINQINNPNTMPNNEEMINQVANVLGCSPDSVMVEVQNLKDLKSDLKAKNQEVVNITAQRDELATKLKGFEDAEKNRVSNDAAAFVDGAIADRKIAKEDREEWVENYMENPERMKKLIGNMPSKPKISNSLGTPAEGEGEAFKGESVLDVNKKKD